MLEKVVEWQSHEKIIFKVEEEPDTDANAKWTTGVIHSTKVGYIRVVLP